MPIGTPLQLVTRIDTKFGQIDDELATKASAPIDGGTFNPTLIDLSAGQIEYNVYHSDRPDRMPARSGQDAGDRRLGIGEYRGQRLCDHVPEQLCLPSKG